MSLNSMVQFRPFQPADADAGIALWRMGGSVRPWNDPHKDSARKLRVNPEWFLIAEREERIGGSVMVGNKGHRGWINDLAVEPALQRSGLGRALMHEAERILRAPGWPKKFPADAALPRRRHGGLCAAWFCGGRCDQSGQTG